MIDAEPLPSETPGSDRYNRRFACVGAALGLLVWFNLFSIPMGIVSAIVLKSHLRLGLFLGFLAQLCVGLGTLWVAPFPMGEGLEESSPSQARQCGEPGLGRPLDPECPPASAGHLCWAQ